MRAWRERGAPVKVLLYALVGLVTVWMQLTLAQDLAIQGVRPNLVLLSVVLLGLRWMEPYGFFYGAGVGLAQDVFSHGMLGVYGFSYCCVSLAARALGISTYEQTVLYSTLGMLGLGLLEGLLSTTLFELVDSGVPWFGWYFTAVLPAVLYTTALAPLGHVLASWVERLIQRLPVRRGMGSN